MPRLLLLLSFTLALGCGSRAPVVVLEAAELRKLSPGTHQESATIPGFDTIRYTIEIPTGYDGKTLVPLVLALHYGYEGDKPRPYTGRGMIEAFRPGLAPLNAIVIAPDALGGSWIDTRNENAAVWLTKSAMKTYAIDPKKVIVTGFSMGGEGAWHVGSRHQDLFTGAIPVAAPSAGGDVNWKIPVYVIHSDKDDIIPYVPTKKHAEQLKAKGAKLEFKAVSGLTHYNTNAYGTHVGDGVKWLQGEWK